MSLCTQQPNEKYGQTLRSLNEILHEATQREDFELGLIRSEDMVADIHTKAYPEARATEWKNVRSNSGILSPEEAADLIGSPGLGWSNRFEFPGKYVTRKTDADDEIEVPVCSVGTERDPKETLWVKVDGEPVSIAADCAGVGSGIEVVARI